MAAQEVNMGKKKKKITSMSWKGKEYPDKSSVAVNPNGVISTYRNDPSFSDESLMASEGEKLLVL